jgi:hypothetical protein
VWMKLLERLGIYKLGEQEKQQLFHACAETLKVYSSAHVGIISN